MSDIKEQSEPFVESNVGTLESIGHRQTRRRRSRWHTRRRRVLTQVNDTPNVTS